jgi:hypothetical protein
VDHESVPTIALHNHLKLLRGPVGGPMFCHCGFRKFYHPFYRIGEGPWFNARGAQVAKI